MESSSSFKRIFSPNGSVEKIPAPLKSHISSPKSPNLSPRSGNQTWLLLVIPYLSLEESDLHTTHRAKNYSKTSVNRTWVNRNPGYPKCI
ncbi:hypothetical protein AVEN_205361-1 [Araneus ventricosus]|uniref:Uncharacterized protein n=1 Tax=Araneus ventricosus TaxID=182803 RepID=A0A4Y2VZV9_ARAVE|nr:hypothetical protein AVEN_205361-1 [Araneus ventricosus]